MIPLGVKAADSLDEKVWLQESHDLCTSAVYDAEVLGNLRGQELSTGDQKVSPISLSVDYLGAGRTVADRRVVEAGHRLGAILKQIAK